MSEWTEEEVIRLRELRARGLVFREIAIELGRTKAAAAMKWQSIHMTLEQRRHHHRRQNDSRVTRKLYGSARGMSLADEIRVVPPEVLAERRYRNSLPVRDLTAAICGDPPIGRSALDRRQGSTSDGLF